MWAVAAQPRTGLTPMIPTPSVDSGSAWTAVTSNLLLRVGIRSVAGEALQGGGDGRQVELPQVVHHLPPRTGQVSGPLVQQRRLLREGDRVAVGQDGRGGDAPFQRAWITAQGGVDLTTGQRCGEGEVQLPRVVLVAMQSLNSMVNHVNGLASSFDRGLAVDTLCALARGGHRFDVDDLCAWALANGFTASEVQHLRDYATNTGRTPVPQLGHRPSSPGHPPDVGSRSAQQAALRVAGWVPARGTATGVRSRRRPAGSGGG